MESKDQLYEELSMLLAGDLPEDQAAVLRDRIAREPEVARAWGQLHEMVEGLAALPELTPPPELNQAVLGGVAPDTRTPEVPMETSWRSWTGWAVAAAAVAWLLLRGVAVPVAEPLPQLVLADGSQWVDGHAMVVAGDQLVEVDGSARITVEPPRGALRVMGVEAEDAMQRRDVLVGALAGAVVTVAVTQGSAKIWPAAKAESEAVAVAAGESRTVGIAPVPGGLEIRRGEAPAGETPAQTIARLTQERDALAEALERSRFEGAMAKGQLAAHQGEAIPWDDTVPAEHLPESIRSGLDRFLEEHSEVALADLDCDEFPCIATFEAVGATGGHPMEELRELPRQYAEMFGESAAVMASVAAEEGADGDRRQLISVAAVPSDRKDGDWATRAQYRTENITSSFLQEALDDAHEQDVDIE